MSQFEKYQKMGAYHWAQTQASPANRGYNAPLAARYRRLAGPVLDAGCGDGYLMHLLLEKGCSPVLGVNLSQVGVGLALKGLNPFALTLGPAAGHGQLLALCRKGEGNA